MTFERRAGHVPDRESPLTGSVTQKWSLTHLSLFSLYHCLFTSIDIVEMVLMFLWVKVGISPGVSG